MTRRARRDGRAARRNEEREKREDEKGAIVSSSPQGMKLKHQNFVFSSLKNALLKCHGVKQNAKMCAIGEQNVIN